MKKTFALILTICALTTLAWAQTTQQKAAKPAAREKTAEQSAPAEKAQPAETARTADTALQTEEKDIVVPDRKWKPIGLCFSLDYMSDYLWRGTYWFNRDGAFFPSISYSVLDTGLQVSVGCELSQDYLFDGKEQASVGGRQAASFGLDYSYSFEDKATLGADLWYYYTFNREENSMMNLSVWATLDAIPFSPGLKYTHDFYFHEEQYNDLYLQLFGSHDFRLTKTLIMDFGLSIGYYYSYFEDTNGISDITLSTNLTYERGGFTIKGGFNYIIVPMEDYWGNKDINRFYATVGISYSL